MHPPYASWWANVLGDGSGRRVSLVKRPWCILAAQSWSKTRMAEGQTGRVGWTQNAPFGAVRDTCVAACSTTLSRSRPGEVIEGDLVMIRDEDGHGIRGEAMVCVMGR